MKIYTHSKEIIKSFKYFMQFPIYDNKNDGVVDLFIFTINLRNFDDEYVTSN